jgi:gentisate 1,2-dioxygenase
LLSVSLAAECDRLASRNLAPLLSLAEYTSAANPVSPTFPRQDADGNVVGALTEMPVRVWPPSLHESGPTRVIEFNLQDELELDWRATSPNLLASFLRVCANESLTTEAAATSHSFYCIRGAGATMTEFGVVDWKEGDLFVVPVSKEAAVHHASEDSALYWINDEPLMSYLGAVPTKPKFKQTFYSRERMVEEVATVRRETEGKAMNRTGILLGNKATEQNTLTLTHTLWSLLNCIPANTAQRPHRHNSVALDLAVVATPGVYTLMGPELDEEGWVKDPIRCEWATGGVFSTPPGWWHSHHNESDEDAFVLPMQDAGLYTHQRTLDIQFSAERPKL